MTAIDDHSWRPRWHTPHPVAAIVIGAAAALAVAPLISLLHIALKGDAEIWPHLAAYVLPQALRDTVLLLAGVAVVTAVIGIGAAWIVTAYRFPGRAALTWMLALPLAFPTYIVAYVYVDVLDAIGPVQTTLRSMFGWQGPADYWFPSIRSLGGAIFVMSLVLYPYVYLDRKSTRLNSSHRSLSRMPSSA